MSYTPGPWKWIKETEIDAWSLGPGVLLTDYTDGTPAGDDLDKANARLIAAAPELMEALQEALRYVSPPLNEYDMSAEAMTHGKCRAILARIKGES